MSSEQQPRTPSPAPAQETVGAKADESSETHVSSAVEELAHVNPDPAFFDDHLKACPSSLVEIVGNRDDVKGWATEISQVRTKEASLYKPVASLLSMISKIIFDHLQTTGVEERPQLPERPIVFLDHHRHAPTHFPVGRVDDKPDIIGVVDREGGYKVSRNGSYEGIPYHCIETIVEAKAIYGDGQAQATRYAFNIQQARPDRPGFYCLSVKPGQFQVVYSSPVGIEASEHKPWSDYNSLCAYVYSLYDPPDDHVLYDRTIVPTEPAEVPLGKPTWTIQTPDRTYTGASIIFLGDPWSRRTTIFRAIRDDRPVIIKESYFDCGRRYEEGELLTLAHGDGFVPGVVRHIAFEDVKNGNDPILLKTKDGKLTRKKRRIVLADIGEELTSAKSVNDLLMAVYDTLEVHRTLARDRQILHRDMSLFNILMYPDWAPLPERQYLKDSPPLIDDVLQGELRPVEKREARCLVIDLDNAARLVGAKADKVPAELQCRTGTPAYIARAVASGSLFTNTNNLQWPRKMPELAGKAKNLYTKLYGEERYNRYKDSAATVHGGVPPQEDREVIEARAENMPFYHRWEYDAESVFWTMYSALLRVVPQATPKETEVTQQLLNTTWKMLYEHKILDQPLQQDSREGLLAARLSEMTRTFLPEMKDVAKLLYDISMHVFPIFAVMTPPPPHDDHVHEAMQRLILQYLVDHLDKPIPLIPGRLRPVPGGDNPVVNRGGYGNSKYADSKGTRGSKRQRDPADGSQSVRRLTRDSSGRGGSAYKIVEKEQL
ncbi:hypothetical protein FKP32DRAFT_1586278 [Trametes sanguinea]|nr:hypothetical protein FKP32DRAFT_1586278 [Trametes sanguinea]